MNIPVVYEDEWLLVVNKPAGLLTIPTAKNEQRTLIGILNGDAESGNLAYRLHPCHRLDKETSGLIIFAKGKSVQRKMMQLFHEKKVHKTYLVFIKNGPRRDQGEIAKPIQGETAITRYKVIERRQGFSIVEAYPFTGRTNQLRIHFKAIACPIVGETRFAFRRDFTVKAKRLCLHAKYLKFPHPVTQKNLEIEAPLPRDLKDFLKKHPSI